MLQEQLVQYVKSQRDAGIPLETVKVSLRSVGWAESDIEDSIKGVEEKKEEKKEAKAASGPTIVVSDLFGKPPSVSDVSSPPGVKEVKSVQAGPVSAGKESAKEEPKSVTTPGQSKRKGPILTIALAVVAMASLGYAAYLYMSTRGDTQEAASLTQVTQERDAARAELASVTSQVTELQNAKGELEGRVTSLEGQLKEKESEAKIAKGELSFFVLPPGTTATSTVSVTLKGLLALDPKLRYILTTSSGVQILVQNSDEEKVSSTLSALLGKTVELSGTHVYLSHEVWAETVDGVSLKTSE